MFYIWANIQCVVYSRSCDDRESGWVEIGPRCLPNFCFISIGSRFNWRAFGACAATAAHIMLLYIHFIESTRVVSYQRLYRMPLENLCDQFAFTVLVCHTTDERYSVAWIDRLKFLAIVLLTSSLCLDSWWHNINRLKQYFPVEGILIQKIAIQVTCSLQFNRTID